MYTMAIQRPWSAAARQVSNAYERLGDLVTNKNVQFRPFLGQPYILESLCSDSVRAAGYWSQRVEAWLLGQI